MEKVTDNFIWITGVRGGNAGESYIVNNLNYFYQLKQQHLLSVEETSLLRRVHLLIINNHPIPEGTTIDRRD